MILYLFLSFLFFISLLYVYYYDRAIGSRVKTRNTIKGPGFIPVFGHGIDALINYHRILDYLVDITKAMKGKTFSWNLPFSPPFIISTDPRNVEYILKSRFESFEKTGFVRDRMHDVLGNGIFAGIYLCGLHLN